MPVTRRDFIKQSAGTLSVSLMLPHLLTSRTYGQSRNRRVLVVIELLGGNDGFNTVIPFTDSQYRALRPTLGFKEKELKDDQGQPTLISDRLAMHPRMNALQQLFTNGRVAIVQGVGYPNPNGSHFLSQDIWHSANPDGGLGEGWLAKYASKALRGESELSTVSILNGRLPKSLLAKSVAAPNISSFDTFAVQTDAKFPLNRSRHLEAFLNQYTRTFPNGSYAQAIARVGNGVLSTASRVTAIPASYQSTIQYPTNNRLATALKMMAQMIFAIPETMVLYVQWGFFDHHARQISVANDKLSGEHASLLRQFSEAVKAFYDDLTEHGVADNVLIFQWSEFGRRPNENRSLGTDHGTASSLFLIGNPVKSGIYGEHPAFSNLDAAGNVKLTVDFRSLYAELLDGWFQFDHQEVLGARFDKLGFLP